jgi:hypothetical protein
LNFGGKFEYWWEYHLGYFRFTTSGDAISGDTISGDVISVTSFQVM